MLDRHTSPDDYLNELVHGLYARARGAPEAPTGYGDMVVVEDPIAADEILKAPERFAKNYSLLALLGRSRFNANGEEWRARRDLTQSNYGAAARPQNRASIHAVYAQRFSELDEVTPAAIQRALIAASSTIFHQAFGCEVPLEPMLRFFEQARPIVKRLQYASWSGPEAPLPEILMGEARALVAGYAAELRQAPDLTALLQRLQARADDIDEFDPIEEFMMNFFAGVETTAASLAWAVDTLGSDPDAQDRIHAEVSAGGDYPLVECFVSELMRFFPPIPFVNRQVTTDTTLAGVPVVAGKMVLISVIGIHHNRGYWREPEVFDAQRPEFMQDRYDRRAFIPFLVGPRICGGAKLARLEVTEGLKAFVRMFAVKKRAQRVWFDYTVALRPNTWDDVEISRR